MKVYAVPLLNPVTEIGEDALVPVMLLGDEVAVKVDTALPPVAPAVNVIEADVFPPVAVPIVGACGTVVAVIEFDAEDVALVPAAFVAVTVNV